ncbi:MAG TPA: DivIVA domain-containing protein [Ornithinimicrobium sp.]|nr:DivIVA domain-containing protein [Ornithinimicrobium sp.]
MSTDDTSGDLQPLPSGERPTAPVPPGVREDMLPVHEDFPTTRVRRGYDAEQVDALIADVFEAVRSGGHAPVIAEARFQGTTLLRTGYEEKAVDDYLDELAAVVGQEPTPEPSSGGSRHPDGDEGPTAEPGPD